MCEGTFFRTSMCQSSMVWDTNTLAVSAWRLALRNLSVKKSEARREPSWCREKRQALSGRRMASRYEKHSMSTDLTQLGIRRNMASRKHGAAHGVYRFARYSTTWSCRAYEAKSRGSNPWLPDLKWGERPCPSMHIFAHFFKNCIRNFPPTNASVFD